MKGADQITPARSRLQLMRDVDSDFVLNLISFFPLRDYPGWSRYSEAASGFCGTNVLRVRSLGPLGKTRTFGMTPERLSRFRADAAEEARFEIEPSSGRECGNDW